MKKLVFASGNENKVKEVAYKMGGHIPLIGLKDIQCPTDLPETSGSLEGNARQKAKYVWDNYHVDCFADDTGLEVEALDGKPGVDSAFFGGPEKNPEANMKRLLEEMKDKTHRKARFRTAICLIIGGKEYMFEGIVNGHIAREPRGTEGFGYDPLFVPDSVSRSFAQMSIEEKNMLSHRANAIARLGDFLRTNWK